MLSMPAKEIYEKSYKISYINELYDFLLSVYEFSESEVKAVLAFKGNVLEEIYDEWTRGDYSIREEYDCVIFKTISYLQKAVKKCA